jgi:hypothetical protein
MDFATHPEAGMNYRGDSDHLFFKYDMHGVMDHQAKVATTDVEGIEADRLRNTLAGSVARRMHSTTGWSGS